MKLRVKLINEKTFECLIINQVEAEKLGYKEMEVEIIEGRAYVKGKAPQPDLKKLKEEKIQELKNNCNTFILAKYPVHRQMNIINPLSEYKDNDRQEMNIFIEEARTKCHNLEKTIAEAKTIKDLDKMNIDFK